MNAIPHDLIDGNEVASLLKIHPHTLCSWRKKSKGPPWYNFDGHYKYSRADVEEYIRDARNRLGDNTRAYWTGTLNALGADVCSVEVGGQVYRKDFTGKWV